MVNTVRLATIPGDGIGTEVVAEALKVLDAVAPGHDLAFDRTEYDLGATRYLATGETLPESVVEELRGHDAILLGAIGDPRVAPGILERGVLLPLRFALDHHVNLRPVRLYPGVASPLAGKGPDQIDFVVCREGTEGPYVGAGRHAPAWHAARGRHRGRHQHPLRCRAHHPRRLRAGYPTTQQGDAGPQDQRAGPRRQPVAAHVRRRRRRVPRRRDGLLPRRRRVDVLPHPAGAVRRRRHRQPLRRHPHRHRRGDRRRASGSRRAGTSTRVVRTQACSSRFTVPPPTSPAGGSPTQPPRSSRRPCCSTTSVPPRPPPRSTTPWQRTSPAAATAVRSTSQIGDAIAERVAG